MDGARFDQVAQSLLTVSPRRGALGLLMGGALGLSGLTGSGAKKKGKGKKKKKKNDACKKVSQACGDGGCAFGARCCSDLDCDSCSNSFCMGSDKDGIGTCGCLATHRFFNGSCGEKPECLPAGTVRSSMFDIRCCSGSQDMVSDVCLAGTLSCLSNEDCVGGQCRGYVCAAATLECQG